MDIAYISSLLRELLSEYNRVSLPCLGSFMGQYKPAYFSADGKTIFPPSKQIEFHQNEIWNDERLEKLIAERENVSQGEAKERLAFWIDDVCVALSTGKIVELPDLGRLQVSEGNKLVFIQDEKNNLLLDSYGLPEIEMDTTIPSPPTTKTSPTNTNNNTPKPKRRLWLWIFLLVLVLLIAAAALIHFRIIKLPDSFVQNNEWIDQYLRKEKINDQALFPDDMESQPETIPLATDSGKIAAIVNPADSLTPDSVTEQINSADSVSNKADSLIYYLVVASFDNQNDARTRAKTLAKKGYVVQMLYVEDENPYKLSVGLFKNKPDAIRQLNSYKENNTEPDSAYIMVKRNNVANL